MTSSDLGNRTRAPRRPDLGEPVRDGPARPPERFAIHESRRERVWIVAVEGEFDLAVDEQARAVLLREEDADSPLVIDLSSCGFIDSTGLRAVASAVRLRATQKRPAALVAPSGTPVRRVLDLTSISEAIPTAETLDDALGRVRSAAIPAS